MDRRKFIAVASAVMVVPLIPEWNGSVMVSAKEAAIFEKTPFNSTMLSLDEFEKLYIEPAVKALCRSFDEDLFMAGVG